MQTDPTLLMRALCDNVERVVRGKREVVERCVLALAAGGHVLLEDVPGVGKTVLARSLARSVGGSYARVQGAPDLLPADVTGSIVPDTTGTGFRFSPGPLFANVVLVDELNRTTPRSQAALLEAMEEGQVSVDGRSHPLPAPHLVVATQNPVEHLGTFPLPESQLDRFTVALGLGYPGRGEEVDVVVGQLDHHPLEDLQPVTTPDGVTALQRHVRSVHAADEVVGYAVDLVRGTRNDPRVVLGASPRACIQLVRIAQAAALLDGRAHVLPDDVKQAAPAVLAHRLVTDGEPATAVVTDLLRRVPVVAPA